MKVKSPSRNKRKPATYRADRGDSFSLQDIEAVLRKSITDMNLHLGSADPAEVSDHKLLSRAGAKSAVERVLAGLNFNQESVDEDSE